MSWIIEYIPLKTIDAITVHGLILADILIKGARVVDIEITLWCL